MMIYFVLIFSFIIGGFAFYYGWVLFRLWLRMKKWEASSDAEVISKKVDLKTLAGSSRAPYTIYVSYRFKVNGKQVEGNKVFPVEFLKGQKGFLKKDAEKFANEIPLITTIYFNPENPEEHIMFRGGPGWALLLMLMGIFSVLIGVTNFAVSFIPVK